MAIQNDNTLVTKGDLKSLYTDKIAPYLGGGISYYYTDRSGQELKSADLKLSASQSIASLAENVLVNFTANSGTFTVTNNKVIIPEGMRVQFGLVVQHMPQGTNTPNVSYRIYDYKNNVEIGVTYSPYLSGGYARSSALSAQYTAPTGGAEIGIKARNHSNNATTIDPDATRFTVQEIGRIVDPVEYVNNNSDLEETPVGNIISYMGNSVPKHYLACDGTAYAIGSYPELEQFFIDEFGSVNKFGGDGTSTWAVPDLRGEFLRGTGTNSHEGNGNGYSVGTHQNATVFPYLRINNANNGTLQLNISKDIGNNYDPIAPDSYQYTRTNYATYNAAANTAVTTGSSMYTSRPTNTSVKYCIKYESTFHAFFNNAAYKVSVAASVASHSGAAIAITLDNSDIIGDASLVSGNSFIAPLDGLYLIGMNWSNNGVWEQNYMINVNGTDVYHVVGIGVTDMLQLQKGDVVTIKTSKTSAQSGRASFALVTSNYNPTIVSVDSVYSENEQMIGYWTDGKPLYQKTIVATSQPNINTWGSGYEIGTSVDTIVKVSGRLVLNNNAGTYTGNFVLPTVNNDDSIIYVGTNNNHSSLPNRVGVKVGRTEYTSRPISITVQYTKTTDTASTLQIENSLLLNRPDLWVAGTEYHFGGGLYGMRLTAAINSTLNGDGGQFSVEFPITGYKKLVSQGGYIDCGNLNYHLSVPSSWGGNIAWDTSIWFNANSSKLIFALMNNSTSAKTITNGKYDIWCTYTK